VGAGQLRRLALEHCMRPLRADGWRQVVAGVTSVEEVRRVLPAGLGSVVVPPPAVPVRRRARAAERRTVYPPKPVADKPAADKPAADKPAADKPAADATANS
jgi:cytochrome c